MITLSHVTKTFGRLKAVDDLSFEVKSGEAAALWGANGAGKTTVIRCILGLLRYDGRITVAGRDIRRAGKTCRRAIGYVPQELAFHNDLRVIEALHYYARLKRVSGSRLEPVLTETGLTSHARKRIGELSGGMKQRLALGIALLADPPLLVLDELTSNLDRAAQASFLSMLAAQKRRGKTILFASHRLDEIELLADRVLALQDGRLQLECLPDRLATAADLRCVLLLRVPEESIDRALAALRRRHYTATRNGNGVLVEIAPTQKAAPIEALVAEHIAVQDFDLVSDRSARLDGGPDRE